MGKHCKRKEVKKHSRGPKKRVCPRDEKGRFKEKKKRSLKDGMTRCG